MCMVEAAAFAAAAALAGVSDVCLRGAAKESGEAFADFAPMGIFGAGGEDGVAGRIQGGFHGILDDSDDEAHANHLHGRVRRNAENGAGHGNQ